MTRSARRTTPGARKAAIVLFAAVLALVWSPHVAHGAVEENVRVSLVGDVFEDVCGEDVIHTEGNLHILVSFTQSDNHVSGNFHLNPQGAKLVGLTTGNEYVGTGMLHESFSESLDGGAATFTFVNNFRLIGKGQAPRLLFQVIVHTTINANGDLTANVELESEECK